MSQNQSQEALILGGNKTGVEVLSGMCLALGCGYVPLVLSFNIARSVGLTASMYPEAASTAAVVGLAMTVISIPIIVDLKNRSAVLIAFNASIIFSVCGVIASLCV